MFYVGEVTSEETSEVLFGVSWQIRHRSGYSPVVTAVSLLNGFSEAHRSSMHLPQTASWYEVDGRNQEHGAEWQETWQQVLQ